MKKRSKNIIGTVAVGVVTIIIILYVFTVHDWLAETGQRGEYNLEGLGEGYTTYAVKGSNKFVYTLDGIYILGGESENNKGTSYFCILLDEDTFREPELMKISSKYLVFSVKEASNVSDRKLIAVKIEEERANFDDRLVHLCYPYDELSWWEKWQMYDVEKL